MKVGKLKISLLCLMVMGTVINDQNIARANEFDDEFSSELPIDVDGSYKRSSAADKIEKLRKQLERQNEEMVSKKIEDLRLENEKKMTKKLSAAFKGNLEAMNSGSTSKVSHTIEKEESFLGVKDTSVTTGLTYGNISGGGINLESNIGMSVLVEGAISNNFSIGFGISKLSYTAVDLAGLNYSYYGGFPGFLRDIEIDTWELKTVGKYNFGRGKKFRPFFGMEIGVRKMDMNYNGQNFGYYNLPNGLDQFNSLNNSTMVINAIAGANLNFSKNFGLNMQVSFGKSLSNIFGDNRMNIISEDQARLNSLSESINDALNYMVSSGLIIRF